MKTICRKAIRNKSAFRQVFMLAVGLLFAAPVFAQATGGSPWENAVNVLMQAFTSTIARGLSLVAIVVSGLTFAFGEGGSKRVVNTVYRSISRPLTILGAERRLFFFAMCIGAGTFNLLGSLGGGVLMFLLLYFAARWAAQTDPQILRILLTSPKLRTQYDPAKFSPISILRISNA